MFFAYFYICSWILCAASGRTNIDLREMLGENPQPGVTRAEFRSKRQTATLQKNEEARRLAAADPWAHTSSRTLPSGRQETTVTRKPPSQLKTVTSPSHQSNSYTHRSETPTRAKHLTPPREMSRTGIPSTFGHASSIPRPTTPANRESFGQRSGIPRPTTPSYRDSEKVPTSPDHPVHPKTPSHSSVARTPGADSSTPSPMTSKRSLSKIPLPSSSKRKSEGKWSCL